MLLARLTHLLYQTQSGHLLGCRHVETSLVKMSLMSPPYIYLNAHNTPMVTGLPRCQVVWTPGLLIHRHSRAVCWRNLDIECLRHFEIPVQCVVSRHPGHSVRTRRSVRHGFSRATENSACGAIYGTIWSVFGATGLIALIGSLRRGISTVSPSGIARKAPSANPAA